MMKKFNPSVLALSISSLLLTSTLTFGQIQQQDKALFGVKEHQESLLFHHSLVKQGSDNVPIWRIPSLLRTKDGVLIAAADKRWQHRGDWGDIDTAIRISHDDGKTWGNITTILDLPSQNGEKSPIRDDAPTFNPWGIRSSNNAENKKYRNSAFLIDAQMVQDQRNGRLFLAVDMYPESTGLSGVNDNGIKELGSGYVNISGKNYLKLYPYGQANGNHWTLRENGEVFDENNKKTEYRVEVNGEAKLNFRNLGNVYKNGEYLGNIYLKKEDNNKNVPFVAPNTAYIWLTYSDDNGKTWVNPIDITSQVKKDWMRFFGTGPGVGIQTKNGNLVLPVYYSNLSGMESAALIISQDGGKSWELGKSPNDTRLNGYDSRTSPSNTNRLTEAQLVELDNGDIKLFMRNQSGKVMMSTSKDGGYTWVSTEKINELNHGYSQLSVIKYSKKINGKEYIVFSGQSESGQSGDALRRNGKLFLGEVQEDGSIVWKTDKLLREISSTGTSRQSNLRGYSNGYVYSSLAELGDGSIGLAYENTVDYTTIMYLPIEMQEFFWRDGKIFSDIRQKTPLTVTYNGADSLEKIGDGIAIKQGVGESLGGVTVSEGTLVLAQKSEQDKNKAFTDVTLNKTGILQVESVQNIDTLTVNNEASGYIQFSVSDESTPMLNIAKGVSGKEVKLHVNLQKKLKPNDKGYYHA